MRTVDDDQFKSIARKFEKVARHKKNQPKKLPPVGLKLYVKQADINTLFDVIHGGADANVVPNQNLNKS